MDGDLKSRVVLSIEVDDKSGEPLKRVERNIENFVDKNHNAFKKLTETTQQFGENEKITIKRLTQELDNVGKRTSELFKKRQAAGIKEQETFHRRQNLALANQFFNPDMIGEKLSKTNRASRNILEDMGIPFIDINKRVLKTASAFDKFRVALKKNTIPMLSVMFFAMGLKQAIGGLLQPAMEAFGIFDLWGATMLVLFVPIMEVLLPMFLSFTEMIMNLPEPVKQLIGAFAVIMMAVAAVLVPLMSIGLATSGWASLKEFLKTVKGFILPSGLKNMSWVDKLIGVAGKIIGISLIVYGLSEFLSAGDNANKKIAAIGDMLMGVGFLTGKMWVIAIGLSIKILGEQLQDPYWVGKQVLSFILLGRQLFDALIIGFQLAALKSNSIPGILGRAMFVSDNIKKQYESGAGFWDMMKSQGVENERYWTQELGLSGAKLEELTSNLVDANRDALSELNDVSSEKWGEYQNNAGMCIADTSTTLTEGGTVWVQTTDTTWSNIQSTQGGYLSLMLRDVLTYAELANAALSSVKISKNDEESNPSTKKKDGESNTSKSNAAKEAMDRALKATKNIQWALGMGGNPFANSQLNDFIWRSGEGAISISPDDNIVGTKSDNPGGGGVGVTINQTLTINGGNADEIRRAIDANNRSLVDDIKRMVKA